MLDPGTQICMDMPGRQETEQTVDLALETVRRRELLRKTREAGIIRRRLGLDDQVLLLPAIAGIDAESPPVRCFVRGPLCCQERVLPLERLRRLREPASGYDDAHDRGRRQRVILPRVGAEQIHDEIL